MTPRARNIIGALMLAAWAALWVAFDAHAAPIRTETNPRSDLLTEDAEVIISEQPVITTEDGSVLLTQRGVMIAAENSPHRLLTEDGAALSTEDNQPLESEQ